MSSLSFTRVLVVAHQAATSPRLIETVAGRAARGPCVFTLLVPAPVRPLHCVGDPEDHGLHEADSLLSDALPVLSEAAGRPIAGVVGSDDALAAIRDAVYLLGFDEIIISLLPARLSLRQRLELPARVRALGLPVTEVAGSPGPGPRPVSGQPAA